MKKHPIAGCSFEEFSYENVNLYKGNFIESFVPFDDVSIRKICDKSMSDFEKNSKKSDVFV